MAKIGLVVPTFNRPGKLKRFLGCLAQQTFRDFTLYLVDSGGAIAASSVTQSETFDIKLIQATPNHWWAAATNLGVRAALHDKCPMIMTINDDAIILPEFLGKMVAAFESNNLRILGARIDYADQPGRVWGIGANLAWGEEPLIRLAYNGRQEEDLPRQILDKEVVARQDLCGDGVLIASTVFEELGLYAEKWCPHYHADGEFTLRANKKGITPYCTTRVVLYNDLSSDGNEAAPPCAGRKNIILREVCKFRSAFLSKKSPTFLLPILYICFKYAPLGKKLKSVLVIFRPLIYQGFVRRYAQFLRTKAGNNVFIRRLYAGISCKRMRVSRRWKQNTAGQ